MGKKNKLGIIIQARNGSTRLPGKVMRRVNHKTIIEYVVERVSASRLADKIIVATTNDSSDDVLADLMESKGIACVRGSVLDVLDRYYQTACVFGLNNIVRITADCPLIDAAVIDQVIEKFMSTGVDYCSNILERTYPDGQDVEVFTFDALEKSWREAIRGNEREHVTVYMRSNPEYFQLANLAHEPSLGKKRWTLDYEEDFALIEKVLNGFSGYADYFHMEDVLEYFESHPDVEDVNRKFIIH